MERDSMEFQYNIDHFLEGLEKLEITLSDRQVNQFIKYYEMLVRKNKVMNLTAITNFDEVIEKHFLDSLQIAKYVKFSDNMKLIDIGTGAGFPGIPIKIAFPEIKSVLLDSLNKRINFIQEVVDELKLDDIILLHGRAEDYGKNPEYRECFDFCVSRAVANLSSLSEYCLPFVKTGGWFIPYKSGFIEDELNHAKNAIFLLGGKVDRVEHFNLEDAGRSLVFIKKGRVTPRKYPRKAGMPSKEPLK